jgi:hypothetical protein
MASFGLAGVWALVLLIPLPAHAQTSAAPAEWQKAMPGKSGKSPEDIAAAKAKWETFKAVKEAKVKASRAAKAEKDAAKAQKAAAKAAKQAKKGDDHEDGESGPKRMCPPGETLDKRSRGGCI